MGKNKKNKQQQQQNRGSTAASEDSANKPAPVVTSSPSIAPKTTIADKPTGGLQSGSHTKAIIDPSSKTTSQPHKSSGNTTTKTNNSHNQKSLYQWYLQERQGIFWVLGCAFLGAIFGFGVGSGYLTGEIRTQNETPSPWRVKLGIRIRSSPTYQTFLGPWVEATNPADKDGIIGTNTGASSDGTGKGGNGPTPPLSTPSKSSSSTSTASSTSSSGSRKFNRYLHELEWTRSQQIAPEDSEVLRKNPSHPSIYAVLREAIVREKGGYVHPDLGFMLPAPCGASRGLAMVRSSYHKCQTNCIPGIANEKLFKQEHPDGESEEQFVVGNGSASSNNNTTKTKSPGQQTYMQEEVLIKVPLKFQMTRAVALETLLPRISTEAQRKANIHELDDAPLLTLLLAHERGVGRYSRWLPYIASLPLEPSCGYSTNLRPYLLDSINALKAEVGLDVNGWSTELQKATQYAERIAQSLARDYGAFIDHPSGTSAVDNISWALCQVASRGIAGSQKHGALRLIPLMDMINHDSVAGSFVELTGKEQLKNQDFVDANEEDSGAFVIRSLRHGHRKSLKVGQELLVNYNVPHYSALDWFVSLGFVPPERWAKWQKMDAALPRIRRDGPFAPGATASSSSSAASGRGGDRSSDSDKNQASTSTSGQSSTTTTTQTKEWDWHSISSNGEL